MNRTEAKVINKLKHYCISLYLSHDESYYVVRIERNKDRKTVFRGMPIHLAMLMNGEKPKGISANYQIEDLTEQQLTVFKSSSFSQKFLQVVEQSKNENSLQPFQEYYDSLTEYE